MFNAINFKWIAIKDYFLNNDLKLLGATCNYWKADIFWHVIENRLSKNTKDHIKLKL